MENNKSYVDKEVIDILFEATVEVITYKEPEEIANIFYDKDPEVINERLHISKKEEFIDYVKKANSMSMKMAEYAVNNIVKSVFKVARKMKPNEMEQFIRNYLDSNFKLTNH